MRGRGNREEGKGDEAKHNKEGKKLVKESRRKWQRKGRCMESRKEREREKGREV